MTEPLLDPAAAGWTMMAIAVALWAGILWFTREGRGE